MTHDITPKELADLTVVNAKDYVIGEAEELHSIFSQSDCYIEFVERLRQEGYAIIKAKPPLMEIKMPEPSPEELSRLIAETWNGPWEFVRDVPSTMSGILQPDSDKVPPTPDYIL